MKFKHNKIRNSALLFEFLVRQITTDALNNNESKAIEILKKYYHNTELGKEYKIYNTLASAKNLSEQKANLLINASIEAFRRLNKKNIRKQKYNLISEIKNNYNFDEFFKSKVDNYKTLASIYLLFEMDNANYIDPEKYSNYKMTILENISAKQEEKLKSPIDEFAEMDKGSRFLVWNLATKKFNEKYSDLLPPQKKLLNEYINNISTIDKLKDYYNTEIVRIHKSLKKYIPEVKDEVRKVKLDEVMNFIHPINDKKLITEKEISNLLYYYELVEEFEKLRLNEIK